MTWLETRSLTAFVELFRYRADAGLLLTLAGMLVRCLFDGMSVTDRELQHVVTAEGTVAFPAPAHIATASKQLQTVHPVAPRLPFLYFIPVLCGPPSVEKQTVAKGPPLLPCNPTWLPR